jgi:transposase InsO family protein
MVAAVQYTPAQYASLARDLGVTLSDGRRGQRWDNAVAESFFATVKTELIHRRPWPTHKATASATFDYVEGWSTPRLRHSALGYISPAHHESNITVTTEQVACTPHIKPRPSNRVTSAYG